MRALLGVLGVLGAWWGYWGAWISICAENAPQLVLHPLLLLRELVDLEMLMIVLDVELVVAPPCSPTYTIQAELWWW